MKAISALIVTAITLTPASGTASSDFNSDFDSMYEQAKAQSHGKDIPTEFFKVVQNRASLGQTKLDSIGRLANYLADDFSLYSRVQNETIKNYCASHGTDISLYLSEFARQTAGEAAVSNKIYARLGTDYESVWAGIKLQSEKNAEAVISSLAKGLGTKNHDVCSKLASEPEMAAKKYSYASFRPSRSQILKSISP